MRPNLTIRLKLLFLVLLASLPALGLALYTGISAGRQALIEAETDAGRISRDLARRQQQLTASTRQFLSTLSRLPSVRGLDAVACAPLFRELLTANPVYSDIVLTAVSGAVLASAQPQKLQALNLGDAWHFKEVLRTRDFAVGGYRKSRTTGLDVLVCAHPVFGPGGDLVGVLSSGLRLNTLEEVVQDIQLPEGSTIYMADRNGVRLFNRHFPNPKPDLYPVGEPIRPNIWQRVLTEPKGLPFYDIGADNVRRIYVVYESRLRRNEAPYLYVGVSLREPSILAKAHASMRSSLALLLLSALLASAAAWLVGRKVFAQRIERLAQVADSFAAGDLSARAALPRPLLGSRPDELGQLGQAVNRIGEELSRRGEEREATLRRLARTQFALDHAGAEIFWADEQARFVYVNKRAATSLGYTQEELLGMGVYDVDASDTPGNWSDLLSLLRAAGPVSIETLHRTKAGALRPKVVTISLVDDGDSRLIFGTAHDISERKQHEAVLHSLLDETATVTGQAFFDALCTQLVPLLHVQSTVVCEYLDQPPTRARTLAQRTDSGSLEPCEFDLAGTPGQDIPATGHLHVPQDAQKRYPAAASLNLLQAQSYLGVPLLDVAGGKIGHLSIMATRPIEADQKLIATLRLFAQRAAGELMRLRAERAMRASLREKEVLLKEIHHRVKNNMQIVSSLLSLQARDVSDPAVLDLLEQSRARILSMALVHEDLYQTGNLAQVDFPHYLERLTDRVRSGLAESSGVRFELDLDELHLSVDQAIPLGLLCNELFTNALKHAFPGGRPGVVLVRLRKKPGQVELMVRDNGQGLPKDFDPLEGATLGLQLVWSLADQLRGSVQAENDNGAVFTLRFPLA